MKEGFVLLRSTLEDAGIDHEKMSCILVKWSSSILNLYSWVISLCYFFDLLVLTREWYVDVMARIRINAFRVELPVGSYEDLHSSAAASVQGEAAVGNAMYMLPAFYNHSCGNISHFLASLVLTFPCITINCSNLLLASTSLDNFPLRQSMAFSKSIYN